MERESRPEQTPHLPGRGSARLLNIRAHEQFPLHVHVSCRQMGTITRSSLHFHRCGNTHEQEAEREDYGSWRRKATAFFQRKFGSLTSPLLLKVSKGCLVLNKAQSVKSINKDLGKKFQTC